MVAIARSYRVDNGSQLQLDLFRLAYIFKVVLQKIHHLVMITKILSMERVLLIDTSKQKCTDPISTKEKAIKIKGINYH